MPPLEGPHDPSNPKYPRAVESCSPEPSHAQVPNATTEPSPVSKISEPKDALSRDISARTKESESTGAGDTPDSSKLRMPEKIGQSSGRAAVY